MSKVGDVRWLLFRKKQAEDEILPPTTGSVQQRILHAQYQTLIWKNYIVSFPIIPNPNGYGWKLENVHFPVTTDLPPAPDAVRQLVKCGCEKNLCKTYCTCRINNLTEMCICGGADQLCENPCGNHVDAVIW